MGTTFRFIADPVEPSPVVDWFMALPTPPSMLPTAQGAIFHFREIGSIVHSSDGTVNSKASPIVTVFLPRIARDVLWTVGEVHFLATPLKQQFPELHKISSAFSKWLNDFPCVYSNKRAENEFSYYLEGSVQNYDPPVFAFDTAYSALQSGRYFVGDSDNEFRLDKICKALRLRGVECTDV